MIQCHYIHIARGLVYRAPPRLPCPTLCTRPHAIQMLKIKARKRGTKKKGGVLSLFPTIASSLACQEEKKTMHLHRRLLACSTHRRHPHRAKGRVHRCPHCLPRQRSLKLAVRCRSCLRLSRPSSARSEHIGEREILLERKFGSECTVADSAGQPRKASVTPDYKQRRQVVSGEDV